MSWVLTWADGCASCAVDTGTCGTTNTSQNVAYTSFPSQPDYRANYFPEQFLTPMAGKTLPMRKVFQDQFRWIADFLFDYDEVVSDTGHVQTNLVFKSLPGVKLDPSWVNGEFVSRWERYHKPQDFYITQDYGTATNTITVWLPDGSGGFTPSLWSDYTTFWWGSLKVWATVLIYQNDPADATPDCCANVIQRTIVAINTANNEITLEAWTPASGFTFRAWDKVKFLYKSRNDCQIIDNTFGMIPASAYRSYLQHYSYTITFQKKELNTAYATPNGAQDFVKNRLFHGNLQMVREMIFSFYRGRNRGMLQDSTPCETQGYLTGIESAQANNPDLKLITSTGNMTTDDQIVRHILDELLKVQSSWLVDTGATVTMLCNQKALAGMLKLNAAWNKFAGTTVQISQNVSKDFVTPVIQTPNWNTQMKYDKILTELYPNEWVILFVPENTMSLVARPNQTVDYVNGAWLVKSQLWVKVEDVTTEKQHECREFDVYTEAALMISGLESGAHRWIKEFNVC